MSRPFTVIVTVLATVGVALAAGGRAGYAKLRGPVTTIGRSMPSRPVLPETAIRDSDIAFYERRARRDPTGAMDLARAQSVSILSRVPASLSPQAIQELARLRRRNRLVAVAASLLIGLMIALGASRVVNGGYLNDALGLSTTDLSTTSATTSTSTSLSLGVVLTGEVLLLALFLLTFAGISHRSNIGPASELAMW